MKRCLLSRSIARNFKANGTTLFFYKYDSYFCALPKTTSRERAGTAIRLTELFGKNRMKALEDRFEFFCHFCKDRFALLWIFMRPSHAEFQMGFPRGRRILSVRCTRDLVRQHLVKNGRERRRGPKLQARMRRFWIQRRRCRENRTAEAGGYEWKLYFDCETLMLPERHG